MKAARKRLETIAASIASFPVDIREKPEKLRKTIRESAPGAEEAIAYGIPTFRLNGDLVKRIVRSRVRENPAGRTGGGKGT